MNNKQNQKKYNQYKIMLKYILSNEIKEVVPTTSADTYHYKNMLKLYKDTKDKYKDECVIIYFIGINEKQEDILWEKKIINSDIAYQEKAKKIHNSSICILNNLIDNLNLFKDKSKKIDENINFINKKIDILLHNIENFNGGGNYEKIQIFDSIQKLRQQRRVLKYEQNIITHFNKQIDINLLLKSIKDETSFANGLYDKKYDYLSKDNLLKYKILKTVKYNSFKERIHIISELEKEYDHVYYDDTIMQIYCYNNANKWKKKEKTNKIKWRS